MSTKAKPPERLDFLDALRGLAVLLMLWMHTADGWLLPQLKQGTAWNVIRALGGLAAPTFLLLAGVSLALSWGGARDLRPGQLREALARALQLVVLGYVLRLQMWMLDAGGLTQLVAWSAALPLGLGYGAAYLALDRFARARDRAALLLGAVAVASATVGLLVVWHLVRPRFVPLMRVDILQAIGASVACVACLGTLLRRWPPLGVVLGLLVAFATPRLRELVPGPLPVPLAGYLAQWTPAQGPMPTLFPLFPWLAYPLIGASFGIAIARARARGESLLPSVLVVAALGVILALLTCEPLPPAHRLLDELPWLTHPVRTLYRVGVVLGMAALAMGLCHPRAPFRGGLLALGRASLFVYWVHLELAFGAVAKPVLHQLDFTLWAALLGALALLMTLLAGAWLGLRSRRRSGVVGAHRPTAELGPRVLPEP